MSNLVKTIQTIYTLDDRSAKGINSARRRVNKFAKDIGSLPGLIAGAGLTAMVKQSLDSADALGKTADKLGTTTEGLAAMRHQAALTADMSSGQFDIALQRMIRRVTEAANGTGEAQGAIKDLGLDAQELAKMGPEKAFAAIADKMQDIDNQGERVRLSFKLFDSEGVALVNTLAEGSEGLEQARKETEAYGTALSELDSQAAQDANDSLFRAGQAIQGMVTKMAIELAPTIEDTAELFTNVVTETDILEQGLSGIVFLVDTIAIGTATISEGFKGVGEAIGATAASAMFLLEGETEMAESVMDEFWNESAPRIVDDGLTRLNAIMEKQKARKQGRDGDGQGRRRSDAPASSIFDSSTTSDLTGGSATGGVSDQTTLAIIEANSVKDIWITAEAGRTAAVQRESETRQQIRDLELQDEAARAEQRLAMDMEVASLSQGIMFGLLGDSKASAIAGFAIEQAKAISTLLAATGVGSMLGFTSQLVPGDPTSPARGALVAGKIEAAGAARATTIAALSLASGALKLGGSLSGGAAGGSGGGASPVAQPARQLQPQLQGEQIIRIDTLVGDKAWAEKNLGPIFEELSGRRNVVLEIG